MIPVIDIGGLFSADFRKQQKVAQEMHDAAHEVGFFYIANHGIEGEFIHQTFAELKRFFDLPLDVKNEVSLLKSNIHRGFDPVNWQGLDANAFPDFKEGYYIGVERDDSDPLVQAKLFNHGPNQWPSNLPGWREHQERYFHRMLDLARRLMGGIALSLNLPQDYFDHWVNNPMATLRLLHYPPHPVDAPPEQLGCGSHTDWGCLTILLKDETGALELQTAQGEWISADPIPGTFVINLGDMMARWTNDYYQSTPHRVMNRSGRDRYSVAFFFDANYHAKIECLSTCQSPENPPKYPPMTAGEHIMQMYRLSYASLA